MNEQQRHGPDLGAVLGGLVLVAVAVAVAVDELFEHSVDWKVYAAGVLLLGGFTVVVTSGVAALTSRQGACGGDRHDTADGDRHDTADGDRRDEAGSTR